MSHNIKQLGPQKNSRYTQGIINPKSCKKLFESQRNQPIIYRSSLEKQFIIWLENNKDIKYWGSECIQVPYFNPQDGRNHTYNPDFILEYQDGRRVVVEIKPYSQTQPPKYQNEYSINQYNINILKWSAAVKFLSKDNIHFKIITENFFKK